MCEAIERKGEQQKYQKECCWVIRIGSSGRHGNITEIGTLTRKVKVVALNLDQSFNAYQGWPKLRDSILARTRWGQISTKPDADFLER